jgi:lipopolysaccharide/colanic/teichoic acid biosynthesis glycosyltransferase
MIKRLFDVLVSFFSLLILSPLLALVALVIKLDSPGPVFYRGLRVGKDGKPFRIFKFRTMADDQDTGPRITAKDDPRVTTLGRVLRRLKINELPQLINILRGEMSLVGPRPEDPKYVALYTPEQRRVLSVLPGMTSIATLLYWREEEMLNGATLEEVYINTILPEKLELDLEYVEHHNFLVDLDILYRTAWAMIPLIRRSAPDVADLLAGPVHRFVRSYMSWFIIDLATAFIAVATAGLIWRTAGPLNLGWGRGILVGFALAFAFSLINGITGVQRIAWRYASAAELWDIALSTGLSTALVVLGNQFLFSPPLLPIGMLALSGFFALAGFVLTRYRERLLSGLAHRWANLTGKTMVEREKVLVVGGGEAGQLVTWMLKYRPNGQAYHIVGIVDDDLWKRGARIHGVRVVGSRRHIPWLVKEHGIGLILFAIHNIPPQEREAILNICRSTNAHVVMIPNILSALDRLTKKQVDRPEVLGARLEKVSPNAEYAGIGNPVLIPQVGSDDEMGFSIPVETVTGWLQDIQRLSAAGDMDELRRLLQAIQTSLPQPPLPPKIGG